MAAREAFTKNITMKKILSVFVIAAGLIAISAQANAQTKIGYMSVDQMVSIMPEAAKIDSLLQKYQSDSLNSTFKTIIDEYNYKDSMLNKTDTSKTPKSILNQYRTDLNILAYQVQNWQTITQQAIQNKEEELLAPLYTKVITALRTVAKEKGYTYVLSKDAFLVAPDGDDLLPAVAAKLGVKLPPGMTQKSTTKPNY
ncbi:MAG: hypothetical protein C4308_02190 [Chitinophagaceae bacterium]